MINKETILANYKEFLEEEQLLNCEEAQELYIRGIFPELMNYLYIECQEFGVPSQLEGIEAATYIEGEIRRILRGRK